MDRVVFADDANDEEKRESYETIERYLEKGIGNKKCVETYDETSKQYEKYLKVANYNGPRDLAKTLEELFPKDRDQVKILDAACGTGLSGEELFKSGFKNVDGVDASEGMLAQAKKKNIYKKLICQFIGENKLGIEEHTYDAVTICGGIGENHIPCRAFLELIPVLKPGGFVVIVTRKQHLKYVDQNNDVAEQLFQKLADEGKWKEEIIKTTAGYIYGEDGMVIVYRVQ